MSSLTGQISFTVNFDFASGVPAIVIQPSTSIPSGDQPNLTGYFSITQPDGITTTGDHTSIAWNGSGYNSHSVPLRLASDQLYQKGDYTVVFYAACTGYDDGTFSRSWNMQYRPVTQVLTNLFDCFTPSLKYKDETNYGVGNYSVTTQTRAWSAVSTAGNPTGTAAIFDLAISGEYYDCSYAINYIKTVNYLHTSNSWLTVNEKFDVDITAAAFIPTSMEVQLGYLISLKAQRDSAQNCTTHDRLDQLFEDANSLWQYMRARVCTVNTVGLVDTFNEFYRLTHNYVLPVYVNTNAVIPAYDFITGCSGARGATVVISCKIGEAPVVTGTTDAVTGLEENSVTVSCEAFRNTRVEVFRGNTKVPNQDMGDGGYFFTKVFTSTDIALSKAFIGSEVVEIKTIPV